MAVSQILKTFPLELFDALKWVAAEDSNKLADALRDMHDEIFNGRTNSLAE
jgi:hypothetical protein